MSLPLCFGKIHLCRLHRLCFLPTARIITKYICMAVSSDDVGIVYRWNAILYIKFMQSNTIQNSDFQIYILPFIKIYQNYKIK